MLKKVIRLVMIGLMITTFGACNNDSEDATDTEYPVITDKGVTASPINCQVYHRGEVIPLRYVFMDNVELGNFNIEIHNDFDHHSHGNSKEDCELGPVKNAVNPWVFNRSYKIEKGTKKYEVHEDIPIPADIDTGDYHFMIRLTDASGWQTILPISIKIG